jgi:hypothetical protein
MSPLHWLLIIALFGIPFFLILRVLWRKGSK